MAKWHAMLEYIQFPLKVLFFATVLLGIGNSIINPNISYMWDVKNEVVILISEIMRYSGGFLIQIFPLLVFLVILTRKFEDAVPVFIGFVSYVVISLVILFLENNDAPSYFYGNMLGIQISFHADSIFEEVTRIPYNTGILSLIVAYIITMYSYLKSRHYSMHGILSFIDHDAWAMILSVFFSVLAGIVFAFGWPLVITGINYFYNFLAHDLLSPINLFLYGISERVSAILSLQEIPRSAFWLGELGGSATDNFGIPYLGDVNTWYAYQNLGIVTTNAGHLLTPYYLINIFLIPGFLLGYYSLVDSKRDRKRYFLFFAIAIALSIICGNSLPMEILMLILAPLLYIVYLLIVGLLYAGLQMAGVSIGYWFEGSLMVANPGSLLDLVPFFRNPDMSYSFGMMITIGLTVMLVFFLLTRAYFKHFSVSLFNLSTRKEITHRVVKALGGFENIRVLTSTPDKLTVELHHRDKVDFDALRAEGAYLILESKDGYLIRLGNLSTVVAKEIKKQMKQLPSV